jgi:DNA-binding response OmpR family regulator
MNPAKILVVDDEKKIVDIVKAYLEKEGYQVFTAFDGKAALESAGKQSPDLIILDLMLPEISGWEVCKTIRALNVPIIMLTAATMSLIKLSDWSSGRTLLANLRSQSWFQVSHTRRAAVKPSSTATIKLRDLSIDREKG